MMVPNSATRFSKASVTQQEDTLELIGNRHRATELVAEVVVLLVGRAAACLFEAFPLRSVEKQE